MVATYRLQLTPEFDFDAVRAQLPYFGRLGISHLYLSPITEAVHGSLHGYDVTDHNRVRGELGGREGFERLREAAVAEGLELMLDVVPNHAGVGPDNEAWQDVLAYGPASPHAVTFDIDWKPLKPELRGKLLLPFLGRPYGDALDDDELLLGYLDGYFHLSYYDNRFRLSPASYGELLAALLPAFERHERYFDLLELQGLYEELGTSDREKAEALRGRLLQVANRLELEPALKAYNRKRLHDLLERQFWRLAYWKTAGDEVNYRRFFDVNELVALRMEEPPVFWEAHRLLGELLLEEGVAGVRIDHIDGLVDPHSYLDNLATLGPRRVWIEKILAPGETLPEEWAVSGTTGYEFMNDALRLLIHPPGERSLREAYAGYLGPVTPYDQEVVRSKRLVMETSLAGELTRLAGVLYRLSEADYHTRDFTLTALREALAKIIASFERYRTYLPLCREEATEVLRRAVSEAKRRAENAETSVYEFVFGCLVEPFGESLEPTRRAFVGRFQQYTAPVAAKGVEDTAFYRYVPLVALNEVGGEPDHFTVELQAFHSRARLRQHRYPENLLATATHDHKRGEDTRMRLAALSEFAPEWADVVRQFDERTQRYFREHNYLGAQRVSQRDAYLVLQHLIALWEGEQAEDLASRLQEYMRKAVREAKQESSWINPNTAYETALDEFVEAMTNDPEVAEIFGPLAKSLARYGYRNALSQLVLKLTTPGVPDIYQGSEFLDLSLVDPDNRRPVDYDERNRVLLDLAQGGSIDPELLVSLREQCDPRLKLLLLHRLLHLRREYPLLFRGSYRPLEPAPQGPDDHDGGDGERGAEHLVAFARESENEQLLVLIPRFMAALERSGGWGEFRLPLPEDLRGGGWQDAITGSRLELDEALEPARLRFLPAVLCRSRKQREAAER